MNGEDLNACLQPGRFIDSDAETVRAFAARAAAGATGARAQAIALFLAVRDEIRYDPYIDLTAPESCVASAVLARGRGWCVGKAALLSAAARALGIPARIGLADVRNHLATPQLLERLGTDIFVDHGYSQLWLDGRWVKATPTFNLSLCERFRVRPLEFDGINDALFHPFDADGRAHMQYLRDHGSFADVPYERIRADLEATYPRAMGRAADDGADRFEREAGA